MGDTLRVRYGTYVFPVPPKVTIAKTASSDSPFSPGVRITWTITGELYDANSQGPTAIQSMRNIMETALYGAKQDFVWELSVSGTAIETLSNQVSVAGITIDSVTFREGDGSEYATHLPYTITAHAEYRWDMIQAISPPAGNVNVFGTYQVSEQWRGNQLILSVNGKLKSPNAATIDAEIALIRLALTASGNIRVLSQTIVHSVQNPSAGSLRMEEATFTIEAIDATATPIVYDFRETISVQASITPTIARPIFGSVPVLQSLPRTAVTIRQSGSCVGRDDWPSFLTYAPFRYALPLRGPPQRTKESPKVESFGPGSDWTAYPISWSYSFISNSTLLAFPAQPGRPILPV